MIQQFYIHIGYFKTGTTWMQKVFFPSVQNIAFVHSANAILDECLTSVRPFDFSAELAREKILKHFNGKEDEIFVLSRERLSGHPKAGGHDSKVIADRLRETFPEASIIIFIREQVEAIESAYKQYVKRGGTCGFKRWIFNRRKTVPSFSLDYFRYEKLIGYYKLIFGNQRVYVYCYEDLRKNPKGLVDKLCRDLGFQRPKIDTEKYGRVNAGASPPSTRVLMTANRFSLNKELNPCPAIRIRMARRMAEFLCKGIDKIYFALGGGTMIADPELRQNLRGYFSKGNGVLQEMLGENLESRGYAVNCPFSYFA